MRMLRKILIWCAKKWMLLYTFLCWKLTMKSNICFLLNGKMIGDNDKKIRKKRKEWDGMKETDRYKEREVINRDK